MKVSSAEFVKSAFQRSDLPVDSLPEIAFLGRSNVGKSSLLNSLLNRKSLARTSNTPGRTQSINFFLVNDSFYFVDLPGYGFAKVSRSTKDAWGKMAHDYLSSRDQLTLCIQLVDSRHDPSALDLQLHEWLVFNQKKHIVVATKCDKLSSNQLGKQLKMLEKEMAGSRLMAYSARTGKGRESVLAAVAESLK